MKRAKKFKFSTTRQHPFGDDYIYEVIITVKNGRISRIYEADWSNAGYTYVALVQPGFFEKSVPVVERGLLDVYELAFGFDLSEVRAALT